MKAMPLDRVTECEGCWYLRSGYLDDTDRIYFELVSERAPKGTVARDLRPAKIEITSNGEDDTLSLPVDRLAEMLTWPPAGGFGRAR